MNEKLYLESGLAVNLTGKDHFRFQDLMPYQNITQLGLKEVDFVFLHEQDLYLLEIKEFHKWLTHPQKKPLPQLIEEQVNDLPKQLAHAHLLLCGLWLAALKNNGLSRSLQTIPLSLLRIQPLKMWIGLDFPNELKEHLLPFQDKISAILSNYRTLFDSDISELEILDYETLIQKLPFITRAA